MSKMPGENIFPRTRELQDVLHIFAHACQRLEMLEVDIFDIEQELLGDGTGSDWEYECMHERYEQQLDQMLDHLPLAQATVFALRGQLPMYLEAALAELAQEAAFNDA